jgi:hypothetical protein
MLDYLGAWVSSLLVEDICCCGYGTTRSPIHWVPVASFHRGEIVIEWSRPLAPFIAKIRIHATMSALPCTFSWCSVKQRDNFTFSCDLANFLKIFLTRVSWFSRFFKQQYLHMWKTGRWFAVYVTWEKEELLSTLTVTLTTGLYYNCW